MFIRVLRFDRYGGIDNDLLGYELLLNTGETHPNITKILVKYGVPGKDEWLHRTFIPQSKLAASNPSFAREQLSVARRLYEIVIGGEIVRFISGNTDPLVSFVEEIYVKSLNGQPDPLLEFQTVESNSEIVNVCEEQILGKIRERWDHWDNESKVIGA